MAQHQMEGGPRYVENPTGQHLLPGGDETPATPSYGRAFDHEEYHDHDHNHGKKSVLAKVREKARKWRQTLAKKRHGHDDANATPAWGVSLDEDDPVEDEQDPEYHGAPMYESETAPDSYKESTSQYQASTQTPNSPATPRGKTSQRHEPAQTPNSPATPRGKTSQHHEPAQSPRAPIVQRELGTHYQAPIRSPIPQESPIRHQESTNKEPELHHLKAFKETSEPHTMTLPTVLANQNFNEPNVQQGSSGDHDSSSKTLTETVAEMLAPAYNMVSDATHRIASKIQSPTGRDQENGTKMVWDKGVSVKEYLMNKFEPGEEERALSEVITEAMSPSKAGRGQGEEVGVVEKVRGAVSSLLRKEEHIPVSERTHHHQAVSVRTHKSSSPNPAPISEYHNQSSLPIPVSTNPYDVAEVEEMGGRRLQAYTN